ncbi:MAG: LysM peptidoglycan-binding domain-containing protein, partial [Bacteroidales bacterium]|nr:LysM peptidoglycan-binding domain-containing protein [Bacteroidales bacterium]
MAERPKGISQDTAEAYALLGIPYEGFVEGKGYQSLMAQTLGSCYFQERGCAIPQFEQVMDSSPEMHIQSVGYQHKVKAGDTLTSISQYYGITITSIMAANPGIDWPTARNNGDLIFAGEVLALPNLGAQEALPKDASGTTCVFPFATSNEVSGMMEGGSVSGWGKCANCLDPSTIGQNLLGLTYPGGNNPRTYADDYSYSYVPKRLSEYPAIGHDRRYDNLGTAGAKGLL